MEQEKLLSSDDMVGKFVQNAENDYLAFKLTKGSMVMHAGPQGYMQLPRHLAQLCLHESLHGFSGSEETQLRQDELRKENTTFNTAYNTLITTYHCGPEEYFVVGAEAYLSEKLMLITHEGCIDYLKKPKWWYAFILGYL